MEGGGHSRSLEVFRTPSVFPSGNLKGQYYPLAGSSSYPSKPGGMSRDEEKADFAYTELDLSDLYPICIRFVLVHIFSSDFNDFQTASFCQMLADNHLLFYHPDAPAVLSTGAGRNWPHGRGHDLSRLAETKSPAWLKCGRCFRQ